MSSVKLHKGQSQVFADIFVRRAALNFVAVCSRGWGKSYFGAVVATQAAHELIQLDASVPNKNVLVIAPTHSQVTDIYYPVLAYDLGLAAIATKHSRDTGRFELPNNVTIKLISYEAIERVRGTGAYFVIQDEVRDYTKGQGFQSAWEAVVQPLLTTRWSAEAAQRYKAKSQGRSFTISTPRGYDFLYDLYNLQESSNEWKSYHFDYTQSPYLDANEISKIKSTVDPLTFAREYTASFEDSGNSVFYCFDRKIHVQKVEPIQDDEDVYACIDFNVAKMCTSFAVERGGQLHFFDEMQGHPDTENLAVAIDAKYGKRGGHKRKVYCFPDPSGRARKTSAPVGQTDFSILASHGFKILARSKAPTLVDSVAAVNRLLKTANGQVNLFIDPSCKGLITSMERTVWVDNNQDTAKIDKSLDIEHFSDGIRYVCEYLYPVRSGLKPVSRGFGF